MQPIHTLRLPAVPAAGPFAATLARTLAELVAAWQRHAARRATARTLGGLDDRTLRDLGFHRSEIGGVAAEIAGLAEPTYLRTRQSRSLRSA